MKLYRVTVDTLKEQYVYEVHAKDKTNAVDVAKTLAHNDGMPYHVMTWTKTERLDK